MQPASAAHAAAAAPPAEPPPPPRKVVLVTGGSGLVGRALQDAARALGPAAGDFVFLSSADGDLRDRAAVAAIFRRAAPVTHVIHLAARVGGLYANMAAPAEFLRDNLLINDHVLEESRAAGVHKLVALLSTCIFPDAPPGGFPMDEDAVHAGAPHASNEGYAHAKRLLEVQCRLYRAQYGCRFVAVVPSNVYGPHDNFSEAAGHVIAGLMRRCHAAAAASAPQLTVWGSGRPLRQFVYAPDLAELLLWALENYDEPGPLILAPDAADEVSIAEVAAEVAAAFDFRGELVFDSSKADGQLQKTASNAKLRSLFPGARFTPLAEGLRATAAWYREAHARGELRLG